MTDFYFRPQIHANNREGWYDYVRFLTDDHPTETGPAWTVVDADDGTDRSQPSGPNNNLTELGGVNLWNPDNPGVPPIGAWIVLESLDSNNTNHCQAWIHFQSDQETQIRLIPLEDFAAGGGSTGGADPTFPATAYGSTNSVNLSFSFVSSTCRWAGYATEGNFIILGTNFQSEGILYFGELDGAADASVGASPPDDRCYVMYRVPGDVEFKVSASDESWIRLSPLDKLTVIGYASGTSGTVAPYTHGEECLVRSSGSINRGALAGKDMVFPIGAAFHNPGHDHFSGWCRGMRTVSGSLGLFGDVDSRNWIYYNSSRINNPLGGWAIKWDGATKFP